MKFHSPKQRPLVLALYLALTVTAPFSSQATSLIAIGDRLAPADVGNEQSAIGEDQVRPRGTFLFAQITRAARARHVPNRRSRRLEKELGSNAGHVRRLKGAARIASETP